jgi:hypothetical protein
MQRIIVGLVKDEAAPFLIFKAQIAGADHCCRMLSLPQEFLAGQRAINVHDVRRSITLDPSDDQAAADPRIPCGARPNPEEPAVCCRHSRCFDHEINWFAANVDCGGDPPRLSGFDGDDLALCGRSTCTKYAGADIGLKRIFTPTGSRIGSLFLLGRCVYSGFFFQRRALVNAHGAGVNVRQQRLLVAAGRFIGSFLLIGRVEPSLLLQRRLSVGACFAGADVALQRLALAARCVVGALLALDLLCLM